MHSGRGALRQGHPGRGVKLAIARPTPVPAAIANQAARVTVRASATMSLRLRLTLVFLAVVAVIGMVSLVSLRLNRGIERQVADLDRTSSEPLDARALLGQGLSIEGSWDERGFFLATEIERLPRSRRPKLRGTIQAVDRALRSLTIYGRTIRMTGETELASPGEGSDPLDALAAGARAEVSCRIDPDGTWVARKIEARGIKSSDKIKGTVTAIGPPTGAEPALSVDGLAVHVPAGVQVTFPRGPLYRMEIATQMMLSVEEALAAAQALLKQRYRERTLRRGGEREQADEVERAVEEAADRLEDAFESFSHYLAESRSAAEEEIRSSAAQGRGERAAAERERIDLWLAPLEEAREQSEQHVARLLALSGPDPDAAQTFLQESLEPALRTQVAPKLRSWLVETEEELGSELQAIAARAGSAARLAIVTNIAGIALAVAAGLLVSRSISGPILALGKAVRRVGRGDLAARVEVRSRDEIGELAGAFNRMAEELSATTVSVARLDDVIDSMAGALLILGSDGRIESVNPAACGLLGYQRHELVGQSFELVSPGAVAAETAAEGGVACRERTFFRKDGTPIPVSFSSATLRGEAHGGGARVCLALDLSERKRIEAALRRSLSEKELLLREVHHRVKNNLQVICSLLDLQSRSISDPQSLERFQESQDRIRSMVFIHDQLHRTDDLETVDLRSYLELLVAHLAQSHADPSGRVKLRTELEELRLDLDRALACGLIVNELVTNALKHAFEGDASGEVVVSCKSSPGGTVCLEVADNGRGFEGEPGARSTASLGLSLVSTLARQLHGRLSSSGRRGASFRLEFPAEVAQEVA